jgi:hypothetical protein
MHGFGVIWQNLPQKLLDEFFSTFSVAQAIYQLSFIVFLAGIYVIYNNIFSIRNKTVYLFFGFGISVILLLIFKLIPFDEGLMFLGFIFIILFGYFLNTLFGFLNKVHMERYNILIAFIVVMLIVFSSVIPTLIEAYISLDNYDEDIESFLWLKQNVSSDSVVVVPVGQAHTLSFFSKKKNIMDSNFILINDVDERLETIDEIYRTSFKNNAIRALNRYNADYISLTQYAKEQYGLDSLSYIDDNCFKLVYDKNVQIYQSLCTIQEK